MSLLRNLLLAGVAAASLSGMAYAANDMSPEAIAERTKPVGSVYTAADLEGIVDTAAGNSGEPAAPRSGEAVYTAACAACHATGAAGAPIKGDADAWGPRVAQGRDTLLSHALNGFNAMPPRGACGNCSDEEITNAVDYMLEAL
ncbi:cytochrome C [Zobellella denitrificans]|uniref:Cytochrome C n=2 Tax=Zobellella denitrificans TaxID=347534 RepID=A0A231N0C1_9GAMM|nr:c-type cytochrome [Zobellella denitrificans]ATG75422.1 cytochrome C [Zobellella denitrificans]OXS15941.1 cytochrome C [Zobellella denitrificans]